MACLERLTNEYQPTLIAIADSPQQKTIEPIVVALAAAHEALAGYVIVSRDGLEAYARSVLAAAELPGQTTGHREAISIGRRLQDPLAEFAKLEPRALADGQAIGVLEPQKLEQAINETKRSCVNRVGVNVNTATESLLRHVAGINELTARRICEIRQEHRAFQNREQLATLPGIGDSAYRQAAGFLRILGGDCPLDALAIHPDHYEAVRDLLAKLETNEAELSARLQASCQGGDHAKQVEEQGEADQAADQWDSHFRVNYNALEDQVDLHPKQLRRYLGVLRSAGRDIRDNALSAGRAEQAVVREGLAPNQLLTGRVANIAPFGVFVDVGQGLTGLVHISRLAGRYISDPRDEVMVGEWLPVWVVSVASERGHIALSAIPPGQERTKRDGPRRRPAAAEKNQHQRAHGSDRDGTGDRNGTGGGNETGRQTAAFPERPSTEKSSEAETEASYSHHGKNEERLRTDANVFGSETVLRAPRDRTAGRIVPESRPDTGSDRGARPITRHA